mgnify:CR=1 FL=1|tara:strand:- start:1370 stop:1894 length:525 start_codon:yes stop_codon:yes gene_type:complete
MKKICTLLFVFFALLSNAQTLEYNRTIDTLLAITIPSGTVFNSSNYWIMGDYLSIPDNKVWKVQSIIFLTPSDEQNNGSYSLNYNNGWAWGSLNNIVARIVLMIKNNGVEEALFSSEIPTQQNTDQGENHISSPLWLSQSELGVAFHHVHNSADPYLIIDYTGYVHVSILEFNE